MNAVGPMRKALPLAFAALLVLGAAACGRTTTGPRNAIATPSRAKASGAAPASAGGPRPREDRDGDQDNRSRHGGLYDSDDGEAVRYGRRASPAERRAVTALLHRYYAAAAAHDGAIACRLLDASLAEGFAGRNASPGGGCAAVVSRLLGADLGRTAADLRAVEVAGVRVHGAEGLALVCLANREMRDMPVTREGDSWRVASLLDGALA